MSIDSTELDEETKSKTTGLVKFFNTFKGYGFIIPNEPLDTGRDVFVHFSEIKVDHSEFATLNKNDEVEFELFKTDRGYEARNVVIIKEAPFSIQRWDTFY